MASDRKHVVQLIHNASSGRHSPRGLAALRASLEAAGAEVLVSESGPGIAVTIAPEASHVCAVGGDGTLRHVVDAVARCGRRVPVSVYPSGTVNLVHREMLHPVAPSAYAAAILGRADPASHYVAEVNGLLFLACVSVGPDAQAVAALSPRLKRRIGRAAYAVAFLWLLVRWRRVPIILSADGREIRCEAFYVAKGRHFAGPWSFAREAGLALPLLHVVALERSSRRAFLRFAWALVRRRPLTGLPGIITFTCTELRADCPDALPVQADGDVVSALPATIRLRPEPVHFH